MTLDSRLQSGGFRKSPGRGYYLNGCLSAYR